MALDHYVSQVHLRKFASPQLNGRLHAIRKSDLAQLTPRTKDVCRIEEGSTNAYLVHDRAIEEFLKRVEPKYNDAVAKFRDNRIDQEAVFVVAGFAAYVTSCSPAAMRIFTAPLKSMLETEANLLDRQGVFGKSPPALGGKSITELLADGTVHFTVDEKFPQAMGISSVIQWVSVWGNSPWEILLNPEPDSPFFTSDFPAALELRGDGIVNRIVPLAPDFCVRIIPDVRLSGAKLDLSFSGFRYRNLKPRRAAVASVNRLIVQSAEELVFHRDDLPWIEGFVAKHRNAQVKTLTERVPYARRFLTHARQRVKRRTG
jgi:Protein of unknown function (DUF4238)